MPLRGARGGRDCSPAPSVSSGGSWSSGCSVGRSVGGGGGVDLVVAGRRYTRARANADGSVRWTCATRGCPASLRTDAKGVVLLRRGARHRCSLPPPPDRASAATGRLGALSADEAAASDSDADAADNLPLSRRLHPAPTGPSGWPLLHPVNPYLTCGLCSGYLIDATTIVDCMHSFCRSCIILHLRSNSFCPTCEQILRRFDPPLHGLRRDHTLQTLVYKMVPGLYRKERERRKAFGQQDPQQHRLPKPAKNILTDEEKINIALQYNECVENYDDVDSDIYKQDKETKRYLKCPAAVRIRYLQHFIRMKYGLSEAHRVDIIYNDECLPHNFTLKDVMYIFSLDKYKTVEFGFRIYLQDPDEQNKSAQNASSVQKKARRPYKRKQSMRKKQPVAVAPARSKLSRSQSTPNVSVCIESPEPSSIVPAVTEEYEVTTKSKRGKGRGRGRRARSGTRKDKNSFASLDDDLLRAGHLFEMEFDSIASTSNYQGNSATDCEDLNHQINDEKSVSPKRVPHQTGASTKDNSCVNIPFVPVTFSHSEVTTAEVGLLDATRDNAFCMENNPRTSGEASKVKLCEMQEDSVGEVISDSGMQKIPVFESAVLSPKRDSFYTSCSPNNESAPSQQIGMPGKLVSTRRQSRTMLSPPRISSSKCNNSDVFDGRHNSQCSVTEQRCELSDVNVLNEEVRQMSSVCGNRSPLSIIGVTEQKGGKTASVDLKIDMNAQILSNCQQNVSVLNSEKPGRMVREESCAGGTEYGPPSKRLCVEPEQGLAQSENIGEGKLMLEGPEETVGSKVDPQICATETQNAKVRKNADAVNETVDNGETERTEVNNGFRRITHKINNNMELISKQLEQKFSRSSKQKINKRCRNKVIKQKRMPLKGTALFKTLEPLSSSLHRKCMVSKVYGLVGFRNMNWNKGRCKAKDTSCKGRRRRIMHSVLIKKFDIDYDAATHSSGQVSNMVAQQSLGEGKTEVHDSSPLHRDTCKTCQNNQSSTVIWKKVVTPSRKRRYSETFEKTVKDQVIGGKINGLTVTGVNDELSGEKDTRPVKTSKNVHENEIANKTLDIICTDSSQSSALSSLQNNTGTASLRVNDINQANSHSSLSIDNVDSTNISNTRGISGKTVQNEMKCVNIQKSQMDAPTITNSTKIATDNNVKNETIQCKESSRKETNMSSKESTSSNKSSKAGDKDSNYSDKSSNYSEFDDFSEEDELILRVSEHEDDEVTSRVSDHEDDEMMPENGVKSQEAQKSANEDKMVLEDPKNNNKISETSDSSVTKSKEGGQKISQVSLPASHELKDAERILKEKGADCKSGQKSWPETNRPDKVTSHKTLSACHSVNNRTGSSISPLSSSNISQQCTSKANNSTSVIPQTATNKSDKKPKGGNLYELSMKPKENTIVPPPSITISRLNSNLKPKQRADTSNSSKNKRPSLEILPVKPSGTQQSSTTDRSKRISLGSPYFTPKRKPANMPLLKPPQLLQNAGSQAQNYPTEAVTKNGLQIIPTSSKNEVVSSSSRKSSVTTTTVSNNANSKTSENAANKNSRAGEAVLDLSEKSTRYKGSSPELLNQSPNEIQPPKSFVSATQIAQNRASLCSTLASNFQHFQHHFSAKTPPQNVPQAGIASALGTALSSALRGTLTSSQAARGIPNDVMHPAAANSSFLVNRNTLSGASMQYCNAKDETEKSVKQQLYQNIQQKNKAAHTAAAASSQNVNNPASQMMYGRNVRMQPGVHMGHVHTSSVCYPETSPTGPKEYPDPRSPIPLSPTTPVSSPLSPSHQAMANFGCLSPTYSPHPLYKSFTPGSSEIAYDRAKRNLMPEHRNPGPSQTVRHIPNPSTLQFRQQRRNCSPSSTPQNVPATSANNSLSSKMPFLHQRLLEASNSASKSVSAASTSATLTLNSGNYASHDKSKPSRRNSANK